MMRRPELLVVACLALLSGCGTPPPKPGETFTFKDFTPIFIDKASAAQASTRIDTGKCTYYATGSKVEVIEATPKVTKVKVIEAYFLDILATAMVPTKGDTPRVTRETSYDGKVGWVSTAMLLKSGAP